MLSWLTRKFFRSKRREKEEPKIQVENRVSPLSKWHLACFWLAHTVGGVDMILEEGCSIFVVSKTGSGHDGHKVVLKTKYGNAVHCHLAVNMDVDKASSFEFKTIDDWSEDLAKFVASIITLKEFDPRFDPEERWGIIAYDRKILFPCFKNEEELFMRMALDGFVCNDEREGDSDAQH